MRVAVACCVLLLQSVFARAEDRITIISDAFGGSPRLQQDWGYAALVEIAGKRILFDAGNDAQKFEANVRALRVDLRRLDFAVISHRHGDHTAGLRFLRRVNPRVTIFAPQDEHFGGPTPTAFFRPDPSLPAHMRYFNGHPPAVVPHGSAWGDIPFTQVQSITEVTPGVRLIPTVSDVPGTRELRELSLAVDTPSGQVLVVGCSHPGVEKILRSATGSSSPVRLLIGGFHWVTTPEPEIRKMAASLRDDFDIAAIAPGHCTGEPAFRELQSTFGANFIYAGVGTVVRVPEGRHPPSR